jgi:hypothetical protein
LPGREDEALKVMEGFLEKHPERNEADAVRMMRVRTMLFVDRVEDARRALATLLRSERVREDDEAREYLQGQLDALDWIGRELPAFHLPDTRGETVSSVDFTGKPTLLFIWDTTSAACLGELPFVQEARKRFGDKLRVVGISVNESRAAFEQWLQRNEEAVDFPNIWVDREQEGTPIKRLNVTMIPFNVLLGKDGKVYRYDVRSDDMLRYAAAMVDGS